MQLKIGLGIMLLNSHLVWLTWYYNLLYCVENHLKYNGKNEPLNH